MGSSSESDHYLESLYEEETGSSETVSERLSRRKVTWKLKWKILHFCLFFCCYLRTSSQLDHLRQVRTEDGDPVLDYRGRRDLLTPLQVPRWEGQSPSRTHLRPRRAGYQGNQQVEKL